MRSNQQFARGMAALTMVCGAGLLQARQSGMQDLGVLGGGVSATRAEAHALSADGQFVTGLSSITGSSALRGYVWTASTGMQELATQPTFSSMFGISDDGSVTVGSANFPSAGGWRACRWTAAGGVVALGDMTPGVTQSQATAVSADGQVCVGYERVGGSEFDTRYVAFWWSSAAGFVELGNLVGSSNVGFDSQALDVSSDGSVVVGLSTGVSGAPRAFRWTSTTGMQDLGTLSGSPTDVAVAFGVSGDGAVIVGSSGMTSAQRPFRWSAATGLQALPTPGGHPGLATATNADGSVVVGHYFDPAHFGDARGFRWTAGSGSQALDTLGAATYPRAVSADGTIVVGISKVGYQSRAFRWSLDGMESRYCAAIANSTGSTGRLEVYGNNIVANNDLQLAASQLPLQRVGYFIASRNQGNTIPFGSQGRLCLSAPIVRFAGAGQVQNTGVTGSFSLALDLANFSPAVGAVFAGDTWNFQAWHRDPSPTLATTNLTDAVSVTFR